MSTGGNRSGRCCGEHFRHDSLLPRGRGVRIHHRYRVRHDLQVSHGHTREEFLPGYTCSCLSNMKLTTLPKVLRALEDEQPVITVPEDIREKAFAAVQRMVEIGLSLIHI